ncbi:hypothetical protein J3F84DRAFT_358985 [Trichoderma pleuroticola]
MQRLVSSASLASIPLIACLLPVSSAGKWIAGWYFLSLYTHQAAEQRYPTRMKPKHFLLEGIQRKTIEYILRTLCTAHFGTQSKKRAFDGIHASSEYCMHAKQRPS